MQASMEELGFLSPQDLWLTPIPGRAGSYYVLHQATRVEGLAAAYRADVSKRNRRVQQSATAQFKHCKIYIPQLKPDVCLFLINSGNSVNERLTATTPLEKWRATERIMSSFEKKKKKTLGRSHQ